MTIKPPPPNMTVNGEVWIDDYDRGVVTTLGGIVVPFMVDGMERSTYAVEIDGVQGPPNPPELAGRVPFQWISPEDPFQVNVYPSISIRRSDPDFDLSGQSWYGIQGRMPKPGLPPITVTGNGKTVTGYSQYVEQWRGSPVRIPYEVLLVARTTREMHLMTKQIMKICFPPFFSVCVIDSKNEERYYDAGEVRMGAVNDLVDIMRRKVGFTISFDVLGELDLVGGYVKSALTSPPVVSYTTE